MNTLLLETNHDIRAKLEGMISLLKILMFLGEITLKIGTHSNARLLLTAKFAVN